jgi:serine/threonine-protein kinase RsbW
MSSTTVRPMQRSWDIPSTLPVVRDLVEEVAQVLEKARWSAKAVFAVRMGLDEAVANAVKHGNRGDETKRVRVDMVLCKDRVEFKVRDQGDGFNPDILPDPTSTTCIERTHGRGVMLMQVYMNEVHYNGQGNEVSMLRLRAHGPEKK